MAKVDAIAEIAADGVADGMHIVSDEALAVEKVVRGIEGMQIAFIGLGVAIGAAVGGLTAWRVATRKAEAKFSEIAAEEIADMRQHYNEKAVAMEMTQTKGDLADIVKERGYVAEPTAPPMAVTPPEAVVDAARDIAEDEPNVETDPTKLTVDVEEDDRPEEVRNIFRDAEVTDEWDWHKERSKRSPLKPYIIHRDERDEQDVYDSVTWTYFEEDDVLCRENDEVVPVGERDKLIGEAHLEKFGHGSGDASIVYVRNDALEIDFEVVRSPNSYAEEVHGFEPEEPEIRHSHRRERTPADDE